MEEMRAILAQLLWTGAGFETGKALLVEGSLVRGVVPATELHEEATTEDWGNVAVMPGTVNAHGHAFQNLFKGFADDRSFDSWRDDVLYPFSERLTADDIYTGALFAFAEALLAGVTTTVDFFYLHDEGNENARQVIRAAHDLGIGLVLARTFYDNNAPTKAPVRYREKPADAVTRTLDLAASVDDELLITVQPAPHSLHAASPATIGVALETARELDVPCHLHLAEASYEVEQIRERYGTTPVRLLAREGLLDERLVAIHAVWLDDEELDLVAGSGAAVVHCPGANAFLGDGVARVPEMLRRGIRVALGPDGGCANNRQSVYDEMRTATLMAKARVTDGSALGSLTALRLGTEAGADVLQLPVGHLRDGARADLVALDLNDLSLFPSGNLERNIVNSMQQTAIERVVVAGQTVVKSGELTRFPMDEIRKRINRTTAGWKRPD